MRLLRWILVVALLLASAGRAVAQAAEDPVWVPGSIDSVWINGNEYCYTFDDGTNTQTVCNDYPGDANVVVLQDDDGNQYVITIYPEPSSVSGPHNYLTYLGDNLAGNDSLQVTFSAASTQRFGFDKKEHVEWILNYEPIRLSDSTNYFVPWKSIGKGQTDVVEAHVDFAGFDPSRLSFKDKNGNALDHAGSGGTYTVTVPSDAQCVYAWYMDLKLGKLNVVELDTLSRRVVVVPVNGATMSAASLQSELNAIYAQANVSWTVSTAAPFSFDLGSDGLEAADATLFSKYSPEMRVLRDSFRTQDTAYDKNAYYLFIVPNFSDPAQLGYMVRGRAAGFLAAGANAREAAHELGHGAFGLEHTFPDPAQGATTNLMDYANGTQLHKKQWDAIHSNMPVFNWLDEEEDGEYNSIVHIALTPTGKFIDTFFIFNEENEEERIHVILIVEDTNYFIQKIKYKGIIYNWSTSLDAYTSGIEPIYYKSVNSKPRYVNIFKTNGNDDCIYLYKVISWSENDQATTNILETITGKENFNNDWITCPYDVRSPECEEKFILDIVEGDSYCSAEEIERGFAFIQSQINNTNAKDLVNVVNSVCLPALRKLAFNDIYTLFKTIALQSRLDDYAEIAILRLMNAMDGDDYSIFYDKLEETVNVENDGEMMMIVHLMDEMNDITIPNFLDPSSLHNNKVNFISSLIIMYSTHPESYMDRILDFENGGLISQIINLNSKPFKSDLTIGIIPLNECRYVGEIDRSTGYVTVKRQERILTNSISGAGYGDPNMQSIPVSIWTDIEDEFINISPLSPVIISTAKELPLVETALGIANNNQENIFVVPAVFLQFKKDKEFVDNAITAGTIALDAITIVASGGTLLATKVIWARRIWALVEVAGAVGNISLNLGAIQPGDRLYEALEIYNGAMLLIGAKNLGGVTYNAGRGFVTFTKSIATQTINAIKSNENIRNFLFAAWLNWKVAITKIDNITSAEKQLIVSGHIEEVSSLTTVEKTALKKQYEAWKMLGVVEYGDELISIRTTWINNLKTQYDANKAFIPQGLNPDLISSQLKADIISGLPSYLPSSTKESLFNTLIKSGSSIPAKKTMHTGEVLYKISPKGSGYSKSSFYMNEQEFLSLRFDQNIEQKLGLPLQSHAIEYDVYKATVKQDIDVFESQVANTIQGDYTTTGGALQTFLLDDSKWTITLEPNSLIPPK